MQASRRKNEEPLPESFEVTPAMRDWARATVPSVAFLRETEKFKDHALCHDRRCRDWVAAWRNWMRGADERLPNGNGHSSVPRPQTFQEIEAEIARGF